MEKATARRRVRQAIEEMTSEARAEKSAAIRERIRAVPEVSDTRIVMGFLPMRDELDTRPILADFISAGKRVYVPRSFQEGSRMVPVRLTGFDRLREGLFGILEPDSDETCTIAQIDLVLVPARAFDRKGNRLGRGAGFYDRFMAQDGFRAARVGIAFDCQVFADIPHDADDLPVQILVTETETLRFCT